MHWRKWVTHCDLVLKINELIHALEKTGQSASARLSGRFSLAAEPGGDNSTQEITVEKQRAVHFSSMAVP